MTAGEDVIPGRSQHIRKSDVPIYAAERKNNVKAPVMKHFAAQVQNIPAKDMGPRIHCSRGLSGRLIDFYPSVVFYFKPASERQTQAAAPAPYIENFVALIET